MNILPFHFYIPHNQPAEETQDSYSLESACFPLRAYHLYKPSFCFLDLLLFFEFFMPWYKNLPLISIISKYTICYCCSVVQSCPTLCDSVDCSMPDIPVLYHLPELAQTHVHWVRDTIQPSHPLSSPLLLPLIFPSLRVFSNELMLHMVAKVLELQFLLHATHYTVSLFHLILKTVRTTLRGSHILVGLRVFFLLFNVDHFQSLYWIFYSNASVLGFRFSTVRYVRS